ncbi:hypothetical protein B296_00004621 [Ensete ventricosum]|uniref:B box-type domain-containing protein n=1 Tax=Ensete ventricosum TaxID=4639 RepID=A0A427B9E7_ENSVE|nr:hypothetical protein B296_00004621 [Ensete ventricosum]
MAVTWPGEKAGGGSGATSEAGNLAHPSERHVLEPGFSIFGMVIRLRILIVSQKTDVKVQRRRDCQVRIERSIDRSRRGEMGVKQCELCDRSARMHCESDQASLCWECDAKVHAANFLVARHSRWLLCQSCQSPTPWRAEGARPGHAISTCERCAAGCGTEGRMDRGADGGRGGVGVAEEDEGEGEGEEADEEPEDDGVDEEGENQVVPWSMTPPPVSSSSSSEEEAGRRESGGGFLKRTRENVDLPLSQVNLQTSKRLVY